jgi:hypothetical protein
MVSPCLLRFSAGAQRVHTSAFGPGVLVALQVFLDQRRVLHSLLVQHP